MLSSVAFVVFSDEFSAVKLSLSAVVCSSVLTSLTGGVVLHEKRKIAVSIRDIIETNFFITFLRGLDLGLRYIISHVICKVKL